MNEDKELFISLKTDFYLYTGVYASVSSRIALFQLIVFTVDTKNIMPFDEFFFRVNTYLLIFLYALPASEFLTSNLLFYDYDTK